MEPDKPQYINAKHKGILAKKIAVLQKVLPEYYHHSGDGLENIAGFQKGLGNIISFPSQLNLNAVFFNKFKKGHTL